jgi:hypothetical protein
MKRNPRMRDHRKAIVAFHVGVEKGNEKAAADDRNAVQAGFSLSTR